MKIQLTLISAVAIILSPQPSNANAQISDLVTFTITGSTGTGGVRLVGFPRSRKGGAWTEVVSDESGRYEATVLYGWSRTVTPVKEGFQFQPDIRIYKRVRKDIANEDYAATELPKEECEPSNCPVAVIPTKTMDRKELAEISTDLRFASRRIRNNVSKIFYSPEQTDPNQSQIILHQETTYIQGYGVLLTLGLNSQRTPIDFHTLTPESDTYKNLLLSLLHIANTRHIRDDEKAILTILDNQSRESKMISLQTTIENIRNLSRNKRSFDGFAKRVQVLAYQQFTANQDSALRTKTKHQAAGRGLLGEDPIRKSRVGKG